MGNLLHTASERTYEKAGQSNSDEVEAAWAGGWKGMFSENIHKPSTTPSRRGRGSTTYALTLDLEENTTLLHPGLKVSAVAFLRQTGQVKGNPGALWGVQRRE